MSTLRKWVAAHAPSRANGPGRLELTGLSSPRTLSRISAGRSATSVPADTCGESRSVPRVAVMGRIL